MDASNSSSELCTWFDEGEVPEHGRSLTVDEVLAYGESPTVLKVQGLLTAKVERDVSESDPPISKGSPILRVFERV